MRMLEVDRVSVHYGLMKAVSSIGFRVDKGEVVALIGSNGAGKSSTLKAIAGLVSAGEGTIHLDGQPIQKLPPEQRVQRGIALSPEGRRLFGRMTVLENLQVGAHTVRSAAERSETLQWIYSLFPRVHERRAQLAGSLSGGEQQMVAIGRALMARPRLLMLDEPSLGIAPKVVAEIADAIRKLNLGGMSIVLVEQNARLALRLAHNAYALERGEVVKSGKGSEMLDDPFVRKAYLGV
jgi:branched-chain amino acid transport system ATP-binding protein